MTSYLSVEVTCVFLLTHLIIKFCDPLTPICVVFLLFVLTFNNKVMLNLNNCFCFSCCLYQVNNTVVLKSEPPFFWGGENFGGKRNITGPFLLKSYLFSLKSSRKKSWGFLCAEVYHPKTQYFTNFTQEYFREKEQKSLSLEDYCAFSLKNCSRKVANPNT